MVNVAPYSTIYVIGRLKLDMDGVGDFLDDYGTEWANDLPFDGTHDLELAAEFAGRQCYDAFGSAQYRKENSAYVENILSQAHGSVLEHPTLMLLITGVSRSLTHELIRHRVGVAYSQRSQRYVNEEDARYVMPPLIAQSPEAEKFWRAAMQREHDDYTALVDMLTSELVKTHPKLSARERRIQARQAARSVLPNATETRIVVTANMRALRHICEVRGGIGAEAEIRWFACKLLNVLKKEAPNVFNDMTVKTLEDGRIGVALTHHKV